MIIGVNNHKRTPVSTMLKLKHRRCSWAFAAIILCLFGGRKNADAFVTRLPSSTFTRSIHQTRLLLTPIIDPVSSSSSTDVLLDYAPAAAALFNNMKTPASILSAGMVSLGFLAPFRLSDSMKRSPKLLRRVELLKRAYILVTLVSFCSELLAVMWATVAVNQLTETVVLPATSVWTLLQRDFDLSWSATNSHFVLGMIGFMWMVGLRGYVMLLAEGASQTLTTAALCGVSSALCLMISVVNRGIESGGGDGIGYGRSIVALFSHYVDLLFERATDPVSFGPLETAAIALQLISLAFAAYAILEPAVNGRASDEISCLENQKRIEQLEKGGENIFGEEEELDLVVSSNDMTEEECLLFDSVSSIGDE